MLNRVTIMGRLTRDPELRRTGNGTAVTSFTVAIDRDFSSKDGEKETDFIDCVAWRQLGDFVAKYFTKGRMIVVDGRLQSRTWTDKEGNKRKTVEIVADNAYFGDSKRDGDGKGKNYNSPQGGSNGGYGANQYGGGNYDPNQYNGNGGYDANQYAGGGYGAADYSQPGNYGAPAGGFAASAGYGAPAANGAPAASGGFAQGYATGATYGAMPVIDDE